MNPTLKKISALTLITAMLLPFSSCAQNEESISTDSTQPLSDDTQTVTETEVLPPIEKNDFDAEFTAVYCEDMIDPDHYFMDEENRDPGEEMDDKVYERIVKIREHLGVDIQSINGGNYLSYTREFKNAISAGDDAIQMIYTHVNWDVSNLIVGNFLSDFTDYPNIHLDEDYWNADLMNRLKIEDKMYLGYSDFNLALANILGFNKDLAAEYGIPADKLYGEVRNQTWTLEKFIESASLVSKDNGDGTWDEKDLYGYACLAWVPLTSFQTGCGIPSVALGEDGEFYVAPIADHEDQILDLTDKIRDLCNAPCSYTWVDQTPEEKRVHLRGNNVLFELMSTRELITYKGEEVKIGILPMPKYDQQQADYETLSWNGMLGISTAVRDQEMVGAVLEMLNYYAGPVKTAFYENLLGSKVAEAPDDAEMLDTIWRTQTSDIGLIFLSSSTQLHNIVYAIPILVSSNTAYMSHYKANARAAEKMLQKLIHSHR